MVYFRIFETNEMQKDPYIGGYYYLVEVIGEETFEQMESRLQSTVTNGSDGTLFSTLYGCDDKCARCTCNTMIKVNNCLINMQMYNFPCECGEHIFVEE